MRSASKGGLVGIEQVARRHFALQPDHERVRPLPSSHLAELARFHRCKVGFSVSVVKCEFRAHVFAEASAFPYTQIDDCVL